MNKQIIEQTLQDEIARTSGFFPVEFLMHSGRLPYNAYEDWRNSKRKSLDDAVFGNLSRVIEQIKQLQEHAEEIGLEKYLEEYGSYLEHNKNKTLQLSLHEDTHRILSTCYRPKQDVPQMDLFFHNPKTITLNLLDGALKNRQVQEAEKHYQRLLQLEHEPQEIQDYDRLVHALNRLPQTVDDFSSEYDWLENQLYPSALRRLEPQSRDFLNPFWLRLAQCPAAQTFKADAPHLHCSFLYARARHWQEVIQSCYDVHQWKEYYPLLELLLSGYFYSANIVEQLMVLDIMCQHFPTQTGQHLEKIKHNKWLIQHWQDFLDLDSEPDIACFPGFILIREKGLVNQLPKDYAFASTGIIKDLILARFNRQQDKEIRLREKLKQHSSELFDIYLRNL